jgi:adenylate kinase family enzyme
MKKIAIFGNAGGGKSTLSRKLAQLTGLPLYTLDLIQFPNGRYLADMKDGGKISDEAYRKIHGELLNRESWIIEGYGSVASAWERCAAADTLVYVDLPLHMHYWGVTTRLAKGLLRNPEGWPQNSPVWQSSMDSYRVVWLCHTRLTPKYRQLVAEAGASKRTYHLKSRAEINAFLDEVISNKSLPISE